jgi:hypothetical protein
MWKIINKLPKDIIEYILPFTYHFQCKKLLRDIRSFIETKKTISLIYLKRYNDLLEYEKNADKNWLVSDIILYVKKYKYNSYYHISYLCSDFIFTKTNIHTQFNIFWSSLSPEERSHFIKIRTLKVINY